MFLKADFFVQAARRRLWASGGWLAAVLLTGCTLPAALGVAPDATPTTATPPAASPGNPASPALAAPNRAAPAPASEELLQALAYADRVRTLSATELGEEVARLGMTLLTQVQIRLVHQGSGIERGGGTVASTLAVGERAQLLVESLVQGWI